MAQAAGPVAAAEAGLTYVNDDDPGITREGAGEAVRYRQPDGRPLRDEATLARIASLVIPPAWTHVWICADPDGHIQATGRDMRGRKQYRYHPRWRAHRDGAKFAHMAAFGRALPAIRAKVEAGLSRRDLSRDRVIALIVRLLEETLARVGNDEYARDNKSFGLTTLKRRHLKADRDGLWLEFRGKAGVQHRAAIGDRRLARLVRRVADLPGQRLFQWVDGDGTRHDVGSADVNAWLKEAAGADVTAKDFRTWAATLSAARHLARRDPPASEAEAKRAIVACVKETAGLLGNTPAVCRAAYIHPEVFTGWRRGALAAFRDGDGPAAEAALIAFLDDIAAAVERDA